MIELLVVVRTIAILVTVASVVVAWIVPSIGPRTLGLTRRIAVATGVAAQLGIATTNVVRGREPWTKLLVPLVGLAISAELFASGSVSVSTIACASLVEVALVVSILRSAVRAPQKPDEPYLEQRLAGGYARIVDARFARFFAIETTVVLAALRYLGGGFRRPPAAGFGATRTASTLPLLLALPIFLIPSTVAVDLLIARTHPLWRLADDALTAYAILWGVGVYATFRDRPHRIVDGALVASFGAFRTVRVRLEDIERARVHPSTFGTRAWKKARAADGLCLAFDGTPVVDVTLARPLALPTACGLRYVRRLALSADDARGLARALARPT